MGEESPGAHGTRKLSQKPPHSGQWFVLVSYTKSQSLVMQKKDGSQIFNLKMPKVWDLNQNSH